MKIDLKHTTKKELYKMLCEEQEKRLEAEEIMKKQAEHATMLNDAVIKLSGEEQRLRSELQDSKKARDILRCSLDEAVQRDAENAAMIRHIRLERDDYFKSYQWCVLHPWKNLWKNLVKR